MSSESTHEIEELYRTGKIIYLDYNATTPIDSEVSKIMQTFLYEHFGNCSSSHGYGVFAKQYLNSFRRQVADCLGCKENEIIFTSGASESNNLALRGISNTYKSRGNHIVTTAFEHPAILEVCKYLEQNGYTVTYTPVDETGLIDLKKFEESITEKTILVTIMHANNEIGTIQPIKEITNITKKKNPNIIVHTDASQSFGKILTRTDDLGVDLLSLAAHKFYGPKGIGVLYLKDGIHIEKQIYGASHERNIRPGTESLLLVSGLAKACEVSCKNLEKNEKHMKEMRDRLHKGLLLKFPDIRLNGHETLRLPNTLNISFPNIKATDILHLLKYKVALSSGSACHTHSDEIIISHVLGAINIPKEYAMGAIRFSTGRGTTEKEIDEAVLYIEDVIKKLLKNK